MSELAKYKGGLTISETELITALHEERFINKSPELLKMESAKLFNECTKRAGQIEVDAGIFEVAVNDLVYSFQHELKQMTLGEVRLAVKTQSKLTPAFSISSRVIFDWINTWKSTKKIELNKSIAIKNKRETIEAPKEYTKEEKRKSIVKAFEAYLRGVDPSSYIYTYLKDFNLLNDVKMIWQKVDKACELYEWETRQNENHLIVKVKKARLEEIKSVKDRSCKAVPGYIQNRAEKLIIKQIFDDAIEFKQHINELLNE